MRFVGIKTVEQQGVLMLHRARDLLVRQRTMLINALRAHLAELGLVAAKGPAGVEALKCKVKEISASGEWPAPMISALHSLTGRLRELGNEVDRLDVEIRARQRTCERTRRLTSIPGVGPITASAIAATVPDASAFGSSRQFAAWLGLTPRAHSSGGRERQAGITKQGDSYLRRLLVVGATAVIRALRKRGGGIGWLVHLLERNHVETLPQQDAAERALNKLARTFATQMEALKRYRTGGHQKVTVEHVTVNAGGQAIVGAVVSRGGNDEK
jgi:transposase